MTIPYTLKCKNIDVCEIDIRNSEIVEIIHIYNKEYAPMDTVCHGNINKSKLNYWLENRTIPVNRDGYSELIKELDIKNSKDYLIDNLALSLSDQYWLKPVDLDVQWDDVNFFHRDYNIIEFSNATFGKNNSIHSSLKSIHISTDKLKTPNASLGGMLKKIWVQKDHINYLIKGSHTLYNLEPVNEALATQIAHVLGAPCVDYTLAQLKGKRTNQLVSVCLDIVDENEHMVSAYSIVLGNPELKIDNYHDYIDFVSEEFNVPHAKEEIEKMLMIDYVMMNEDRHLNNFGLTRDTQTLKWSRVCPIYDSGKAMNTAINEEYWNFESGEVRSFNGELVSADKLLEYIDIPVSLSQINQLKELTHWYEKTLYQYQDILKLKETSIVD